MGVKIPLKDIPIIGDPKQKLDQCNAELGQLLERHGCMLIPSVLIEGGQILPNVKLILQPPKIKKGGNGE